MRASMRFLAILVVPSWAYFFGSAVSILKPEDRFLELTAVVCGASLGTVLIFFLNNLWIYSQGQKS